MTTQKKLLFALLAALLCFGILSVNISSVNATTFSKQLNNYILSDYPAVSINEYYEIDANYINGYGLWNVYRDDYSCIVINGDNLYSNWHISPDSTKYYDNGSFTYCTGYNRTPYTVMYNVGDELLCADTYSFSTYLSSGYALGKAYVNASFEWNDSTYYIYPELDINF
jgi:hypothetical protein